MKQPQSIAKPKRQRPKNPAPGKVEQAQAVIDGLISGLGVHAACAKPGAMSWGEFCQYKEGDSPEAKALASQYARAIVAKTERLRWEMHAIADDGRNDWMESNDPGNSGYKLNGEHVQRSKLRIDTIKFELSKIHAQYKDPGAAGSGQGGASAEQMQAWFDEVAARLPV